MQVGAVSGKWGDPGLLVEDGVKARTSTVRDGMRLCLMVTSSVTATTFLRGYLEFLRKDGWQVTLVCSDGPGVAQLAALAGADFIPLSMERDPSPMKDLRSFYACWRMLRALRPDVLVYATPKASLVAALAGWLGGVPRRVYELWGLRLETTSGASRVVYFMVEWLTMRLSNHVIANSRSLADRAVELRLVGARHIETLGAGSSHGVDSSWFSIDAPMPTPPAELVHSLRNSDAPVVGFVGRLHPDKGITTLLDAVGALSSQGIAVRCLLVGSDEGADLAASLARARSHAIVDVTGHVEDPRPYYRVMDLLVLPSRREGFPNVVLEAAAMQVPAIVSDATGCKDSVAAGVTGEIFPVNDSIALANSIRTLLADPERLKRMGSQARNRALTEYNPVKVWKSHSDAFQAGQQPTKL